MSTGKTDLSRSSFCFPYWCIADCILFNGNAIALVEERDRIEAFVIGQESCDHCFEVIGIDLTPGFSGISVASLLEMVVY